MFYNFMPLNRVAQNSVSKPNAASFEKKRKKKKESQMSSKKNIKYDISV